MAEINTNLDTTPLPPNNLVAKDPQSAELAGYVRTKTFGRDVRESIARSIELNSTRSKSAENVAKDLTDRFNQQIGALTEDAEVIDARGGKTTLKQRLDETDAQLAQKAKQDDLVVERARIDSLSRLSEGSTTGDAELIDARVGADGITYDTAGGAIRGQIGKINNDLVAHKLDVTTFKEDYTAQFNKGFPSQANDLMGNRTYTIKLQLSYEGNPQLISKEVV